MKGKVKWYNVPKGYGFILGEDGTEYFVHFTGLVKGTKLFENDDVTFDVADTEKGKQAQNVQKLGGSSAPPERESKTREEKKEEAYSDNSEYGEDNISEDSDVSEYSDDSSEDNSEGGFEEE